MASDPQLGPHTEEFNPTPATVHIQSRPVLAEPAESAASDEVGVVRPSRRWSGRKTAIVAAVAIGLSGGVAVAAAGALPEGTGASVGRDGHGGPGGFGGPGGGFGQGGPSGQQGQGVPGAMAGPAHTTTGGS